MIGGGSASKQPDPLYVDMGLPSGRLWAKSNLDVTQPNGFAASPFQYECSYFSWGNVEGHNPIPGDGFDYNWGYLNSEEPFYENQPYGETTGVNIVTNLGLENDAAHVNLGLPWRMPTSDDFAELIDNCDFVQEDGVTIVEGSNKLIAINNTMGIYLRSKTNGKLLFFATCGYGSQSTLLQLGSVGRYSSSEIVNAKNARALVFSAESISTGLSGGRYVGVPIRPVI